ncbi:basic proline-rich protein-like [Cyrtonyx montezumae]|uniref:basic proline-rich protein-like n=1 Tax=Cyrtonyx montezumae TaxID=9017 RepID=UPI0032DB9771
MLPPGPPLRGSLRPDAERQRSAGSGRSRQRTERGERRRWRQLLLLGPLLPHGGPERGLLRGAAPAPERSHPGPPLGRRGTRRRRRARSAVPPLPRTCVRGCGRQRQAPQCRQPRPPENAHWRSESSRAAPPLQAQRSPTGSAGGMPDRDAPHAASLFQTASLRLKADGPAEGSGRRFLRGSDPHPVQSGTAAPDVAHRALASPCGAPSGRCPPPALTPPCPTGRRYHTNLPLPPSRRAGGRAVVQAGSTAPRRVSPAELGVGRRPPGERRPGGKPRGRPKRSGAEGRTWRPPRPDFVVAPKPPCSGRGQRPGKRRDPEV